MTNKDDDKNQESGTKLVKKLGTEENPNKSLLSQSDLDNRLLNLSKENKYQLVTFACACVRAGKQ